MPRSNDETRTDRRERVERLQRVLAHNGGWMLESSLINTTTRASRDADGPAIRRALRAAAERGDVVRYERDRGNLIDIPHVALADSDVLREVIARAADREDRETVAQCNQALDTLEGA